MHYDRLQDQINLWFLWVLALSTGCAIGWAAGEWFGRMVYYTYGWTAGHLVGWSIFEASVWLMRWQILRRISTVPVWRRLDSLIWVASEIFAWALGEGIHQLSPTLWVTASAVWGIGGGAALWFVMACIRQAKPGRWFLLSGMGYGLLGFVIGNLMLTGTITLANEVERIATTLAAPLIAWALGGAILGAGTGGMTGLAVARLWFKAIIPA